MTRTTSTFTWRAHINHTAITSKLMSSFLLLTIVILSRCYGQSETTNTNLEDIDVDVDEPPRTSETLQTIEHPPNNPLFDSALEYRYGLNGKAVDVNKAMELYNQCIQQQLQHDEALYALGQIYELGEGNVERNFTLAMKYYNESAEYGNPDAQQALGFLWATGKGQQKTDYNKPVSLLYSAFATQGGNTAAELTLGYKYLFGHNVQKSCAKAVNKYELVASKVVNDLKDLRISTLQTEFLRLSDVYDSVKDRNKEEEDIVQYYQYSADTGDPAAQVTMGTLHLQGGYGVEQDYAMAFKYFQQAAAQGDPAGISNLGFMYAQGFGTEQDNQTAIKFYREAAAKGLPQAQTNLGYMYLNGFGVPKNLVEAHQYFKLAADQGHAEGQLNLGTLYYNGEGVKQDYTKALTYFSLAGQQGNLIALYNLGQMHQHGLGTQPACSLAVQLYKKVAEKGPWSEMLEEAHDHFQEGDFDGALLRYETLAEQGYEVAQSNAGWLYDKGLGNIAQHDELLRHTMAFEHYRNSAEQKNALSHLKIGDYYYYGLGTQVNMEKAAMYYQAAADMRNAQAMFNLGFMHQHGMGIPKDLHLAKRYYDMTLQTEPDSYLAVYLALVALLWDFVKEGQAMMLIQAYTQTWTLSMPHDWIGVQLDTLAIVTLCFFLIVCIIIRNRLIRR